MNFAVAQAPSLMKEVENVKAVSWQKTTLDREYGGPGKCTYIYRVSHIESCKVNLLWQIKLCMQAKGQSNS